MPKIFKYDFRSVIAQDTLDGITNADDGILQQGIQTALEEVASYLRHRYDMAAAFPTILQHSSASPFSSGDVVYTSDGISSLSLYTALQDVPGDGSIPIGNIAYWSPGDPRNQKVLNAALVIVLYIIYGRLYGQEIPNYIANMYDGGDPRQWGGVVGYLKGCQRGTIQPDLPLLEAVADGTSQAGNRIAYGSASTIINRNTSI